jgi:hypothetical protein
MFLMLQTKLMQLKSLDLVNDSITSQANLVLRKRGRNKKHTIPVDVESQATAVTLLELKKG